MKSVCFIVQSVYDFDPRVRRKAEALLANGYAVDVLALRPARGKKTYTLNGVNVRTLGLGKKRGTLLRYLFEYTIFFLWASVATTLLMLRKRYAVIDVNSLPDFLVFSAVLARWMGAELVLDLHEITPEFYRSKYGLAESSLAVRLLTYLEKISVAFADHVITINEPIQDLLARRGLARAKSIVIMNAADEERFATAKPSSPASTPGKFVMMYHGTLTHIYGLDIAIRAFAQVHDQIPGAEFWILGAGQEKGRLAGLVQDLGLNGKVQLLGQVPAEAIPGWLNQCHAGVLPIRRDVFLEYASPNKLPEFIITGKPVIISRLSAIRHYFTEDALAFFDPGDPGDLARQMVRVYGDAELRTRMAIRAREEYAPIRWDVMKARYLRLIEALAHGAGDRTEALESAPVRIGQKQ